jgi:hypothetical protein
MSGRISTSVVRDGLILLLDAGNTRSYRGVGATWSDLSIYGNNGTLVNNTFSSLNNGSIVFNGSGSYVSLGDKDLFSFTSGGGVDLPFSVSGWFKLNAYGTGFYTYSSFIMKSQYINTWSGNREWLFAHGNLTGFGFNMFTSDASSNIGKY